MPTELQEKIAAQLDHYADLDAAREDADKIAEKTGCSPTYVRRMIARREETGTKVQFKVEPKEDSETEPEEGEDHEPTSDEDETELESEPEPTLTPPKPDDWDFEKTRPPEPAPEGQTVQEIRKMDLGEIISKENCAILIATPFQMAADWTDYSGWALTEQEEKQLAPMFRAILIKYLPTILAEYFAEVIFAVVIVRVIATKGKGYRAWQAEREKTEKAQKLAESAKKGEPEPAPTPAPPNRELTKDSTTPSWLADGRSIG